MSIDDPELLLRLSDQQWAWGQLNAARASYQRVLELAGGPEPAWRARFQLAWIDAAFAPPSTAVLATLCRADLPPGAAQRVELLAQRTTGFLPEGLAAWDIEALATQPVAGRGWQERAARAAAAGQYGLAQACHARAAALDPGAYVRPPSEAGRVAAQTSQHLAALSW